jgi:CRISPR/Cas system-associated exonuclease Cas4 (RecB family)
MKYVLHLAPERRGTGLALGSAVHGAAAWWFEERAAGHEPTVEDALRILHADLGAELAREDIDWRGASVVGLRAEGERLARTFLAQYGDLDVVATEVPFELAVIDPITGEQLPRRLVGYFDFELRNGNVVELKTAKAAYSEVALATNLQFAAYRTAARYAGVDVEVFALVKTKMPRVQHVVLPHSRDVSRWFLTAAAQIERAILAGHFPPAPGMMCSSCEYRTACMGASSAQVEVGDAEAA